MDLILELTIPIRKSIQRFCTRKPLLIGSLLHLKMSCGTKTIYLYTFKTSNSRRIYFFIKEGIFSISQLNCPSLSINRIDIQYIRPNENPDTNLMDFFKESKQIFQTNFNGQQAFIDQLDKSLILGDRDSSYFVRIYSIESNSALKFELEIRKRAAKKLGLFL